MKQQPFFLGFPIPEPRRDCRRMDEGQVPQRDDAVRLGICGGAQMGRQSGEHPSRPDIPAILGKPLVAGANWQ